MLLLCLCLCCYSAAMTSGVFSWTISPLSFTDLRCLDISCLVCYLFSSLSVISDLFLLPFCIVIFWTFLIYFWFISYLFLICLWFISDLFLIYFWFVSDLFLIPISSKQWFPLLNLFLGQSLSTDWWWGTRPSTPLLPATSSPWSTPVDRKLFIVC